MSVAPIPKIVPDPVLIAHNAWHAALGERSTHEWLCPACRPSISFTQPQQFCPVGERLAVEEQAAFDAWSAARFSAVAR